MVSRRRFLAGSLGAGLTLTTMTETAIAANHRDGIQVLYAAEAGIDIAVNRLRTTTDWRGVVEAGNGSPFLQGRLADLVQSPAVDSRIDFAVFVSPDPNGNEDVLVLDSSAGGPGALRRNVQVTVTRGPAEANGGARQIATSSWRER